jgi:hypothetical protein
MEFTGRYICVDPGEDTGFSLLEVTSEEKPVQLIDYCTMPYKASEIRKTLCALYYYGADEDDGIARHYQTRGLNTVILEKFVHRPGKPFNPTAYKVMGIAESWHQDFRDGGDPMFEYIERMPVQGKSEAPDAVLRKLGVHLKGINQRHINDATRHGVSWLIEQGHKATCLIAKPKEDDD